MAKTYPIPGEDDGPATACLRTACLGSLNEDERAALMAVFVQAEWRHVPVERAALETLVEALDPKGACRSLANALRAISKGKRAEAALFLQDINPSSEADRKAMRSIIGAVGAQKTVLGLR